jgi:diguanylate cyclase (GGDEF)-like protein
LIGTTTDGVLQNENIYCATKSVVSFTTFSTTKLRSSIVKLDNSFDMNFNSGTELASKILTDNTKAIITFADGIYTNGEEFLKGISNVDSKVIVAGGLAGDNGEIRTTYVFDKETIIDSGAVGVSLNSDILNVYTEYAFDWLPIGKAMKITKAVKNRVYEIDGIPVVDVYAKYMGKDLANKLPQVGIEFPLITQRKGKNVGRAVLFKHDDNSLTFAGNLHEGEEVRFGVGNVDTLLQNSDYHMKKIVNRIQYKPEAVFIYSCMARRRFMKQFMVDELENLKSLGNISGFFTYGEFFHTNDDNEMLNETSTLLALSEDKRVIRHEDIPEHQHNIDVSTEQVIAHLANTVSNELAELNETLEGRIKHSTDYIYKQAYFDKLTDLPNRLSLLQAINDLRGKTIFLVNIDDFTIINDFYGHAFGDKVLIKMAQILSKYSVEEGCDVFKQPSDEFALISQKIQTKDEVEQTCRGLIEYVERQEFVIDSNVIHISITVAAAYLNKIKTGLPNADMSLKEAKRTKKPYLIYNDALQFSQQYEENLKIANEIKSAIENDRIIPYFQPIFDIKSGEIVKYEALVRLEKENGEILSPYYFLNVCEKIKVYSKITRIMIEKTFDIFSKNGLQFSINLGFSDILNVKTREFLFFQIDKYDIASQLTIEILETEEYSNESIITEFTQDVYKHGAKVAIDDFGSGFANFQHMTTIRSDFMKIDGSLIRNIDTDENARLIVETIVIFAEKLNKKTVAEFVRSREIYEIVKELGIDYAQGFYLGEPEPAVLEFCTLAKQITSQ